MSLNIETKFYSARWLIIILLGSFLLAGSTLAAPLLLAPAAGVAVVSEEELPKDLTINQIDGYLADLTDPQTRKILRQTLEQQVVSKTATEKKEPGGLAVALVKIRVQIQNGVRRMIASVQRLAASVVTLPAALEKALDKVTRGDLSRTLWEMLFSLGTSGLVFFGISYALRPSYQALQVSQPVDFSAKLQSGLRILFVRGYAILGFSLALFLWVIIGNSMEGDHHVSDPFYSYGLAFVGILIIRSFGQFLLAPNNAHLRLLRLDDREACFVYRWLLVHTCFLLLLWPSAALLVLTGMPLSSHLVLVLAVGLTITLLLLISFHHGQDLGSRLIAGENPSPWRFFLARHWHWLATAYLVIVYLLWAISIVSRGPTNVWTAIYSALIILLLPTIDRIFSQWIRQNLKGPILSSSAQVNEAETLNPVQDGLTSQEDQGEITAAKLATESTHIPLESKQNLAKILIRSMRIAMILLAGILVAQEWGVDLPAFLWGGNVTLLREQLVSAGLVIAVCMGIWWGVRILIDPHLVPVSVNPAEGDEGSHAPRTRLQTLLPIARNAILVILVLVGGMIALSELGIDIAPLLAGAGVVGLAIGFGAQALVRDIVSGIFFLIDDAFRVGEYIEMDALRGTVENISVRSLKLRHHRGKLQTIPFGELRSVTNHSRDWVIYKMEFRLPFDTDVALVKKLVKKVGQTLLEHPDIGSDFLQPMKSQGVNRMEESAMILRVKFMSKPLRQFTIRREAYMALQRAFAENGIKLAPRGVMIDWPKEGMGDPEHLSGDSDVSKMAVAGIGGAAAVAAIIATEESISTPTGDDR